MTELTENDLEWLDRIGVDSKRMKIIKQNQKLRGRIEKKIEDFASRKLPHVVIHELQKLLEDKK